MKPHVSIVTLGVRDVARARRFYAEGLGWPVAQEHGEWVCFALGDGRSALGLAPRAQLGATGAPSGFALHYVVGDDARVADVLAEAARAGGRITEPATAAPWGGAAGAFTDPEGVVWKVASGAGARPFAAE